MSRRLRLAELDVSAEHDAWLARDAGGVWHLIRGDINWPPPPGQQGGIGTWKTWKVWLPLEDVPDVHRDAYGDVIEVPS